MALAHAIESKVEAAYRRGDLFEKRRKLMDAWAQFCDAPIAIGDVTPIRTALWSGPYWRGGALATRRTAYRLVVRHRPLG
jgi:hypothetical protein